MVVVAVLVLVLVALTKVSAADELVRNCSQEGGCPAAVVIQTQCCQPPANQFETSVTETLTNLTQTVTELRDALKAGREVQQAELAHQVLLERCTAPWSVVGANCLLLAMGERQLSWAASRQYCAARGGDLATISDANTYVEYIAYLYSVNTENIPLGVWVGGSDEEVEGVWKWVTGEPMPRGSPFWGSNDGRYRLPWTQWRE